MRTKIKLYLKKKSGSVLILAVLSVVILFALGLGLLSIAYGVRNRATKLKNEVVAMLAAEAGYEQAIFWMGQQQDMLSALQEQASGLNDTLSFPGATCDYEIELFTFVDFRPVYRILSTGHSGVFNRTVDVYVIQAISGWDMGLCRVPLGKNKTTPVYFVDDEIIDMPVYINDLKDSPDNRDIYIDGEPQFLNRVGMGESRYTDNDYDKYMSVMDLFESGIYFDQPDCKITDEATIQSKLNRFKNSTKSEYRFTPAAGSEITNPHPAVQLEFFVENGVGKVRITNNCTVRGYQRNSDDNTLDFKIKPDTDGEEYQRYDIYAYHFMPDGGGENRVVIPIEDTYVTQSFGGVESEPGGQIFVEGDVIIGGDLTINNGDQIFNGRMTVVVTDNVWIADSILLDGPHDTNGMPTEDNPNIFGLVAGGVVKVIDPGMSSYGTGYKNYYPGPPVPPTGYEYVPVGRQDSGGWVWVRVGWNWVKQWQEAEVYDRHLPDPMIVEAAITVGGGGWGAENVEWNDYGGRKEESSPEDNLVVRGAIIEAIRGVVGRPDRDGFIKNYYMDERVLEGILPGDIWLRGKFLPSPAGWHDYRI